MASSASPFAACTVTGGPGTNYPNAEVEPFVAVNPTNAANVIVVFQENRFSNGGAHGLMAATLMGVTSLYYSELLVELEATAVV
jgi:hypothetical protein